MWTSSRWSMTIEPDISMAVRIVDVGVEMMGAAGRVARMLILSAVLLTAVVPEARGASPEWPGIPQETSVQSGTRKGVRVSTDILLVAMPAATLAGVLALHDWEGLKEGALTAGTTVGATLLLKWVVDERRPNGSNHHSFPSGHSSCTFATATFLQRRYGWKFGVPAYVLATYTAWGRVYARRHHWWDVVAGAAIGAGSAWIFTTPWAREHQLSVIPVSDGRTTGVTASFIF